MNTQPRLVLPNATPVRLQVDVQINHQNPHDSDDPLGNEEQRDTKRAVAVRTPRVTLAGGNRSRVDGTTAVCAQDGHVRPVYCLSAI